MIRVYTSHPHMKVGLCFLKFNYNKSEGIKVFPRDCVSMVASQRVFVLFYQTFMRQVYKALTAIGSSSKLQLSSAQSLSHVQLFVTPWITQHTRLPCPSPTPGVHSDSRPSSQWCHPAISSSVIPFSSCPQSLPASGSFPMSQLFPWGGQSIGVSASASVLPMNTQD